MVPTVRATLWCLKMKYGYDAHVYVRPTGAINRARTVGGANAAPTVGAAYPHLIFKEHHGAHRGSYTFNPIYQ